MFIVNEIHMPRSMGGKLEPVSIESLAQPFETLIKEALFSFPYKPDNYYYVISVREKDAEDDFLLIIDPDLQPKENELFVSVIDNAPVVRKYAPHISDNCRILGTVAHASKAASINTTAI